VARECTQRRRELLIISEITLTDFLSFGPGARTLKLSALNVLIGPNGSGKSNLIEAFSVLRAVPKDLPLPIRQGGGVSEWIWRGGQHAQADSAAIEIIFAAKAIANEDVRYRVEFGSEAGSFIVLDERIENRTSSQGEEIPYFYFGYERGQPRLNSAKGTSPWDHVKARKGDGWDRPPGATDEQLHFMHVCMETWLIADPDALAKVFGSKFEKSKLPAIATLEKSNKQKLYESLSAASKATPSGRYGKGDHSFRVLGEVAPQRLRQLTWAKRFLDAMGAVK
jgi:hypothetical protein